MNRVLQSSWLPVVAGGLIYWGVTVALLKPSQFQGIATPAQQQDTALKRSRAEEPSWKFHNPEFDQWVQEIKREKEALGIREQQLKDLQARLESEREELNAATQTIRQLQMSFDKNVVRIKDQEVENLKRQSKILSSMSADGAAGLVNQMSEDEAVRILFTMKADEASLILETLGKVGKIEARRAAILTEKMRHTLPPDPNERSKTAP